MTFYRVQGGEVTTSGETSRYQHGSEPEPVTVDNSAPAQQPQPQQQHNSPRGYRYNAMDGSVEALGLTQHQTAHDRPRAGSVMATMQRQNGAMTVELTPGDPASRTLIQTALRDGLVRQIGPGLYEDSSTVTQPSGDPQQPQGAPEVQPEASPFDGTDVAVWDRETANLAPASYDRAVAGAVAALSAGSGLDSVVATLAEANGLQLAEGREVVETGVEFFKGVLTADLVGRNLVTEDNAEAFYAAARDNPQKLQRALLEFAHERRTDTFREMALEWKRSGSQALQAKMHDQLAAAGFQTTVDRHTGELMVQRGSGPWASWSQLHGR